MYRVGSLQNVTFEAIETFTLFRRAATFPVLSAPVLDGCTQLFVLTSISVPLPQQAYLPQTKGTRTAALTASQTYL
jgi:hypothetical protein